MSLIANFYLPIIHDNKLSEFLLYVIQYYILIKIYIYLINKKYGYLVIKIDRKNEGIYIHKVSNNTNKTKVLDSNNKEKDVNMPVEKGDKIIFERNSKRILSFSIDEK